MSEMTTLQSFPLLQPLPPIILFAYKRAELLEQVLQALTVQTVQPSRIIAFVDAAADEAEQLKVGKTIVLLERFTAIPIECHIRETHLGCRGNMLAGISQVFTRYEAVVVLEDDVVPAPFFYETMCRLLAGYREHSEIFSVSAYGHYKTALTEGLATDFFVKNVFSTCGWATWSDRWEDACRWLSGPFNPYGTLRAIPAYLHTAGYAKYCYDRGWNMTDDWGLELSLHCLYHHRRHIGPRQAFIRNIGFGCPDATLTTWHMPVFNASYQDARMLSTLPATTELVHAPLFQVLPLQVIWRYHLRLWKSYLFITIRGISKQLLGENRYKALKRYCK